MKEKWKAQPEGIYLPKQRSKSTQRKKKKTKMSKKKHQKVKGGSNMLGPYAKNNKKKMLTRWRADAKWKKRKIQAKMK